MNRILISGYYGFANAGDEAMLSAIIGGLRAESPQVQITVLSGNPAFTAQKHGVKSIHRFNALAFLWHLSQSDLLLSGGGSLLQDVTSSRSLFYYLSVLLMGELMGKKVMLFAQGIGPIKSPLARRITQWVCNKANLLTVRDDGSYEELKAMGVEPKKIVVTADAVFSLPTADKPLGRKILKAQGVEDKPVIIFALRQWSQEARFVREFAQTAERLRDAYNAVVVFLPLQFPADMLVAQKVLEQMQDTRDTLVLQQGFSAKEYLAIISNCHLLIGMRLHALVFAALANVQFLAVSYDPKVDRFVNSMGGKAVGKIETVQAETMCQAATEAWDNKPVEQTEKINSLREQARRNIRRAIDLLA